MTAANPQGLNCPWNEIDPFLQGEISAKSRPHAQEKGIGSGGNVLDPVMSRNARGSLGRCSEEGLLRVYKGRSVSQKNVATRCVMVPMR